MKHDPWFRFAVAIFMLWITIAAGEFRRVALDIRADVDTARHYSWEVLKRSAEISADTHRAAESLKSIESAVERLP